MLLSGYVGFVVIRGFWVVVSFGVGLFRSGECEFVVVLNVLKGAC